MTGSASAIVERGDLFDVIDGGELKGTFANRAGAVRFIQWYEGYWLVYPEHSERLEAQKRDSLRVRR